MRKQSLRVERLAHRRTLSEAERLEQSAQAVAALLAAVTDRGLQRVAAYASFGTEPATGSLLRSLRERSVVVLLPVVLASKDLSWVDDSGVDQGVDAIASCDLVVVPGLAADRRGHRLGRGGGSYDRALARVQETVPRVLLLYAAELLDEVPTEPHDEVVTHVAMPSGVLTTSAWSGSL